MIPVLDTLPDVSLGTNSLSKVVLDFLPKSVLVNAEPYTSSLNEISSVTSQLFLWTPGPSVDISWATLNCIASSRSSIQFPDPQFTLYQSTTLNIEYCAVSSLFINVIVPSIPSLSILLIKKFSRTLTLIPSKSLFINVILVTSPGDPESKDKPPCPIGTEPSICWIL